MSNLSALQVVYRRRKCCEELAADQLFRANGTNSAPVLSGQTTTSAANVYLLGLTMTMGNLIKYSMSMRLDLTLHDIRWISQKRKVIQSSQYSVSKSDTVRTYYRAVRSIIILWSPACPNFSACRLHLRPSYVGIPRRCGLQRLTLLMHSSDHFLAGENINA